MAHMKLLQFLLYALKIVEDFPGLSYSCVEIEVDAKKTTKMILAASLE